MRKNRAGDFYATLCTGRANSIRCSPAPSLLLRYFINIKNEPRYRRARESYRINRDEASVVELHGKALYYQRVKSIETYLTSVPTQNVDFAELTEILSEH